MLTVGYIEFEKNKFYRHKSPMVKLNGCIF